MTGEGTMQQEYGSIGKTLPTMETSISTAKDMIQTLKGANLNCRISHIYRWVKRSILPYFAVSRRIKDDGLEAALLCRKWKNQKWWGRSCLKVSREKLKVSLRT